MNSFLRISAASVIFLALGACTRIETGEVGLRVDLSKQVQPDELVAGSWNQTLVGDVLTFPFREVKIALDNKEPQTSDNSTMKRVDVTIIYNINPSAVSDIWVNRSRGFHVLDKDHGDWYLMYKYVEAVGSSAIYKAVRKYEALKVADNRSNIERDIKEIMTATFAEEKLGNALSVGQVQVRDLKPNDQIVASANEVIRAQNDLKTKMIEVQTADQEAKRIAALNSNSKAIEYMQVQAMNKIADGVASGKVHTIVVPFDFKGMVNIPATGGK